MARNISIVRVSFKDGSFKDYIDDEPQTMVQKYVHLVDHPPESATEIELFSKADRTRMWNREASESRRTSSARIKANREKTKALAKQVEIENLKKRAAQLGVSIEKTKTKAGKGK